MLPAAKKKVAVGDERLATTCFSFFSASNFRIVLWRGVQCQNGGNSIGFVTSELGGNCKNYMLDTGVPKWERVSSFKFQVSKWECVFRAKFAKERRARREFGGRIRRGGRTKERAKNLGLLCGQIGELKDSLRRVFQLPNYAEK